MTRGRELASTIGAVYAAGLDATLWAPALAAMTELVGGVGATLEVIEKPALAHREFRQFGLPPAEVLPYLDHYSTLNPRLPYTLRQRSGEIAFDHLILGERAMDRSAFYAEFLPSMGLRYCVLGILDNTPQEISVLTIQRSPRQGHIDRAGIGRMELLVPHVRQALDMATRLGAAAETSRSLESALDWLADGVALVRADGAIGHANAAFAKIARDGDGIRIRKGAIEFSIAEAHMRLDEAIGGVARLRGGDLRQTGVDFHVPRPSGAAPYLVSVRPLLDKAATKGAVAVVFIRDPVTASAASLRALREMFGMTRAEAHLAQAIQAGTPVSRYAQLHGTSINTVYTHLRRIKEKTGCGRMVQLVRKLNELQFPLRDV
jgi:DNA-binding CsgD family transcriptional regulator